MANEKEKTKSLRTDTNKTKSNQDLKKLKNLKGGSVNMKNNKLKTLNNTESNEERYFKLVDPKSKLSSGRYTGATPKQAASKAYTKLLQKVKQSGGAIPKTTTLYLRESTRNSAKKVYGYAASRIKLTEPQQLTIKDKVTGSDKTITYNYRNKIKKISVPDVLVGGKGKGKSKHKTEKKVGSKTANKHTKTTSKHSKASKQKKTSGSKSSKHKKTSSKSKKSSSKSQQD